MASLGWLFDFFTDMPQRLTQEQFISQCRQKHGDKYDYSKAVYKNGESKVCIICPIHGEFWQTAINHRWFGCGCPRCAREEVGRGNAHTKESFIARSIEIYGDEFDYSEVDYVGYNSKVKITCKQGHSFYRSPKIHLNKHSGCPFCSATAAAYRMSDGRTLFIKKAKKKYGDRYDYSKVEYVDNATKVCIVCPEHGEFWQTPAEHLSKRAHGCPMCHKLNVRKVVGVGINDVVGSVLGEEYYKAWIRMLRRAYSPKCHKYQPAYTNVTVSEDWHYLSNFKKWFEENYVEGYALDKDLLSRGAKVYSAETCCYIPPEINSALVHSSSNMGVHENHNKFETIVNRYGKRCFMGSFNTRAEAVNAYIKGKIAYIKELGESYYAKGLITKRVYDGLQNYSVPYPA